MGNGVILLCPAATEGDGLPHGEITFTGGQEYGEQFLELIAAVYGPELIATVFPKSWYRSSFTAMDVRAPYPRRGSALAWWTELRATIPFHRPTLVRLSSIHNIGMV